MSKPQSEDDLKVVLLDKSPAPIPDEKARSPSKISRASPRIITESEYSKAVPTAPPTSSKLNAEKSKQGISELIEMLEADVVIDKPAAPKKYGIEAAPAELTVENAVEDLVQDLLASDFKSEPATTASVSANNNLSVMDKNTDFLQSNQSLSNQSIVSASTSQHRGNDEPVPEWVKEGAHVIVSTNSTVLNKRGHVRFIGPTKFGHGTWIGVELEEASGKNDGSVKGVRYFECPVNKGVFVRVDKLTPVRVNLD